MGNVDRRAVIVLGMHRGGIPYAWTTGHTKPATQPPPAQPLPNFAPWFSAASSRPL